MTDFVTSSRGDRVAYDRYGPVGEGPALVVVAGAGSLRGEEADRRHRPARRRAGGRRPRPRPARARRERRRGPARPRPGGRGAAGRRGRGRRAGRAVRALVGQLDQPVRGRAGRAGRRAGAVGGARGRARGEHEGVGRRARAAHRRGRARGGAGVVHEGHAAGVAGGGQGVAGLAGDLRPGGQPPGRRGVAALGDRAAGVGRAARAGGRAGAVGVRQLHVPGDDGRGRADPVGPAADGGPRGARRAPHVGAGRLRAGPGRLRPVRARRGGDRGRKAACPSTRPPAPARSTRPSRRRRTGRGPTRSGSSTWVLPAGSRCGWTRSGSPTATAVGWAIRRRPSRSRSPWSGGRPVPARPLPPGRVPGDRGAGRPRRAHRRPRPRPRRGAARRDHDLGPRRGSRSRAGPGSCSGSTPPRRTGPWPGCPWRASASRPACPRWATGPASGHSIVGLALLAHRSLRVEAVGRCWSRGRHLAWLADDGP